jgi:hypothetical protein
MITHPIEIDRVELPQNDEHRQRKTRISNAHIAAVEYYVNSLLEAQIAPIQQYSYHTIAADLQMNVESVRACCIDGGSNGFTAYKKGLTLPEALALAAQGT